MKKHNYQKISFRFVHQNGLHDIEHCTFKYSMSLDDCIVHWWVYRHKRAVKGDLEPVPQRLDETEIIGFL